MMKSISTWMEQTLENLPRQSPAGWVAVRPEQLQISARSPQVVSLLQENGVLINN